MPIFVKIAPDLDEAQVERIAATLQRHGIDGVIATNTTVARDARQAPAATAEETGGLSGAPVFAASNRVIRMLRAALGTAYPIIGVGGVMSGADALAKIAAGRRPGADLHRPDLPRAGAGAGGGAHAAHWMNQRGPHRLSSMPSGGATSSSGLRSASTP